MKQFRKAIVYIAMLVLVMSQTIVASAAVNSGLVKKITSVTNEATGKKVSSVTLFSNGTTDSYPSTLKADVAYTWKSDLPAGLKVSTSDRGVVKANYVANEDGKSGKVTLTAIAAGKATVTIADANNPKVKKNIKVTVKTLVESNDIQVAESVEVAVKGKVNLDAVVAGNASNKKVGYATSDKTIVKVDSKGNITGVKAGEATITITAKDQKNNAATKTVKVTVVEPTVKKVAVSSKKGNMETNVLSDIRTYKLADIVTVTPIDGKTAGLADVAYKTSNAKVATVDKNGKITAVGNGSATITVSAKNNSKVKATYKVKVTTYVDTISLASKNYQTVVGKSTKIAASTNAMASNKKLEYAVKSVTKMDGTEITDAKTMKKYVTVGKSNGKVSGKDACFAVVEIKAKDKNSTAGVKTINITVYDAVSKLTMIDADGFKYTKDIVYIKDANDVPTVKLAVKADTKKGTPFANTTVTWSTNKASVATVSQDGLVTAVGNGKAKITATSVDGTKKKATFTLTVKTDAYEINVEDAMGSEDGADALAVLGTSDGFDGSVDGSDILFVEAGKSTKVVAATNADASNKKLNKYTNKVKLSAGEDKDITITAKDTRTHGGKDTANAVSKDVKVIGVSADKIANDVIVKDANGSATIVMKTGDVTTPKVKVVSNEAGKIVISQKVTWSTKDKKIVTVNKKTGEIKAKKEGTATVTATYTTNNKTKVTLDYAVKVGKSDAQIKTIIDKAIADAIKAENRDWTGTKLNFDAKASTLKVTIIEPNKKVSEVNDTGLVDVVKAIANPLVSRAIVSNNNSDDYYEVYRDGAKLAVVDWNGNKEIFANVNEVADYIQSNILINYEFLKDMNGLSYNVAVIATENGIEYSLNYTAMAEVDMAAYKAMLDADIMAKVAEANAATEPSLGDYKINPLEYSAITNTLVVTAADGTVKVAEAYAGTKEVVLPVVDAALQDVVKVEIAFGDDVVEETNFADAEAIADKLVEKLNAKGYYEYGMFDGEIALANVTYQIGSANYVIEYKVAFKIAEAEEGTTDGEDGTGDGNDAPGTIDGADVAVVESAGDGEDSIE